MKTMAGPQKSQIPGRIKEFNGSIIDEDISQVAFTNNKHNSKRHMSEK